MQIDWSVFPQHSNLRLQVVLESRNSIGLIFLKIKPAILALLWVRRRRTCLPVVIVCLKISCGSLLRCTMTIALNVAGVHRSLHLPIRRWAQCLNWLAGCTGKEAVFDPFCGSGTMLIEAGMRFSNTPIFQTSPWLFDAWEVDWTSATFSPSRLQPRLLGSDRDSPSVEKAKHNAAIVNVTMDSVVADVRTVTPESFEECPDTGVILCNPPTV